MCKALEKEVGIKVKACSANEDRCDWYRFEFCHGDSHNYDSPFYLDGRFIYPIVLVLQHYLIPDMALSDIVRFGDRSFMALLFPSLAIGRSFTRCADGQTKCSFRNSLCSHCSWRNANVASLAWRRTCADRRGHPGLQIMNPAGCKSDESNQFSQLEIWNLGLFPSIRIGGCTWLRSRKRLGLNQSARKASERGSVSDVDI
jgi:hypothetical protein